MPDVEPREVRAPELVQGQRAGAGVPEPHGAVRVAAVGQALNDQTSDLIASRCKAGAITSEWTTSMDSLREFFG